jgi:hypothetical protein
MSTRNKDRLGVENTTSDDDGAAAAAQIQSQQEDAAPAPSLNFNFVTPTEFVEIPSKGRFYPPGHPLHNVEVVEVKHMTTKEEDILSSVALIKKGIVFERLLSSVLVDRTINVDSLLAGDKTAIIVALRAHNYGPIYSVNMSCPACNTTSEHEFDLTEFKTDYGYFDEKEYELEVEPTNRGTFLIKNLPISKWSFEVRSFTGEEEKKFSKKTEARKKKNMMEEAFAVQIDTFTVSIDQVGDRTTISKAISVLPAKDSRLLRKTYGQLMPKLELSDEFVCQNCNHQERVDMPFEANFFWTE